MNDPQGLSKAISRAKQNLAEGYVRSEADVRLYIVSPVLRGLNWNTEDPLSVRAEYPVTGVKNYRFDYALFSDDGKRIVLVIETKAPDKLNDDARDQLLLYAMKKGTTLGLLTDGKTWSFYLPLGGGSSKARLVRSFDLRTTDTADAVDTLERYLERSNVLSGQAARNAEMDRNHQAIRRLIEESWQAVKAEEPQKVSKLIAAAARKANRDSSWPLTYKVISDSALRFVRGGFTLDREVVPAPDPAPRTTPDVPTGKRQPVKPGPRTAAWIYRGTRRLEKNPTQLFVNVIAQLQRDHGGDSFCEKFQEKIRGRKLTNIGRTPEEAGGRRKLTRPLADGWHINTNLPTKEKMRRLELACEAAGIRWGSDLEVELKAGEKNGGGG